jgi:hypothetical protein
MSIPIPVVDGLLKIGSSLIDRLFPDPNQKAAAQLELIKLQQSGELAALAAETDLAKGQLEINKTEAASSSLFVAGWRPGTGWICNAALAYHFLIRPLLITFGKPAPALEIGDLLTLLLGLLGLGGLRTKEKLAGVAR